MKVTTLGLCMIIMSISLADEVYKSGDFKISQPAYDPVAIKPQGDLNSDLKYKIHDKPSPDREIASEPEADETQTWRNPSSVEEAPPSVKMKETETLEKWYYLPN